jgi:hypothetical protein
MLPRVTLTTPRLLPVYLEEAPQRSFTVQLEHLRRELGSLVHWLEPQSIDAPVPEHASAVVVPDLSGVAYRKVDEFSAIDQPILVITSEFGTVSMWDWEIRDDFRRRGITTIAPLSLQEARDICRALAVKETLAGATMLAYQDDLGSGKQPDIFKRFYWWEGECVDRIQERFGVQVEHRSYRELAARADAVGDDRVEAAAARIADKVPMMGLTKQAQADALRMYVAIGDELDESGNVIAAGINCLNESATSRTTPCLSWNLLFEERGLMWGCEADLVSMLTEFLVHKSLEAPVMMSNLYPFLLGDAALKHERIPYFPDVDEPHNHVLVAHCGYFGVVPQSFAKKWNLRPKVLGIVDENAHAIDAEIPEGDITVAKLAGTMDTLVTSHAQLSRFVQYADSDCLNGAMLRVEDGYRFVENLPSHHAILATGDLRRRLDVVAPVLGVGIERI